MQEKSTQTVLKEPAAVPPEQGLLIDELLHNHDVTASAPVPLAPASHALKAGAPATGTATLVGQVIACVEERVGPSARVRWQASDGQAHEADALLTGTVQVRLQDTVLFVLPDNWPQAVILAVLSSTRSSDVRGESRTDPLPILATVDGKRVEVVGQDEVVLRCGDASITLRRNGRVVIRGTYVESHAKGTNRIKGGSVLIN